MDNKFFICENINIFGYLGARGGGGGGGGGGGLQYSDRALLGSHVSTLSLIIIYMSNIKAI